MVGGNVANEAINGTMPADAGEADALVDLHAEREALERRLLLTQQRQRFGTDAADVARAAEEERVALGDLDRVLTRIRAAEYRRQPGARRW
ncbi:hypothetical protein [Methylobacterium gossipiicola]|uniref:Uncharacterized protein n=1 Tax=Methylobacterium gossipiicola TaxID=582675 RepID=A0A1I2VV35_9HYPH|nr:hypothetical protein [Methylobacterium gossipiicola]SFG92247.1 hypothetical protein SAMN05192565_11740 [Methylobacterium gossipiicola]